MENKNNQLHHRRASRTPASSAPATHPEESTERTASWASQEAKIDVSGSVRASNLQNFEKKSVTTSETAELIAEMDDDLAELSLNLFGEDGDLSPDGTEESFNQTRSFESLSEKDGSVNSENSVEKTSERQSYVSDAPTETVSLFELRRLAEKSGLSGDGENVKKIKNGKTNVKREIPAAGEKAVDSEDTANSEDSGNSVNAVKIAKGSKVKKGRKAEKSLSSAASLLKVTESPHLHSPENTRSVMMNVLIALCPILLWGIYSFGLRVLVLTLISVISCVLLEIASELVFGRKITVADLSAVVTAVITVFLMPASAPLWMPVFCAFISIVIAKQLFGGVGRNIVNPAILARLVASAFFPAQMTNLTKITLPAFEISPAFTPISNAPIASLKGGSIPAGTVLSAFFGGGVGCIGEISAFLIIIAFIWLVCTKTITFHTPIAFVVTSAVLFYLFPQLQIASDMLALSFTGFELFSGTLMLGAVFLATEYGSTPKTHMGKTVFGVLCGALSVVLRYYLPLYDGVALAILFVSLFSRIFDKWFRPVPYGFYTKKKEVSAAAGAGKAFSVICGFAKGKKGKL